MSQLMPTDGFKWLTEENIFFNFHESNDILNLVDDVEDEYILEVDLHYPKE